VRGCVIRSFPLTPRAAQMLEAVQELGQRVANLEK
jgi:hypothetical protein